MVADPPESYDLQICMSYLRTELGLQLQSTWCYRGGGRSFVMVRPKGEGMGPPKGVPKVRGSSPGKSFEKQP